MVKNDRQFGWDVRFRWMVIYKIAYGCSKSDTPGFDYGISYLMMESCWENYDISEFQFAPQ